MNIKKNFLSRIARRKGAMQAESEDRHEIPPPAAIEPFVPNTTGNSEAKGFGSHQKLELIASGETAPTDSANGVDSVDGGDASALEALVEPVTDESPDAPEPPLKAAPYEEYALELELLTETESKASRKETESSQNDEIAAPEAIDNFEEASASEAGVPQETESEAMDEITKEEEPLAPVTDESSSQSDAASYEQYGLELESLIESESEVSPEEPEPSLDESSLEEAAAEDKKTLASSVLQDSPDEDEPPLVDEEADSEIAESAAEAAAPEPEISKESEPPEDITEEVGEPLAAAVIQDSPDEYLEPALAENGIFPLVRDARGTWRSGKGFSRGELREAGLSLADASRLHIRFDKRRRNTHPVNVASLEQAKSGV